MALKLLLGEYHGSNVRYQTFDWLSKSKSFLFICLAFLEMKLILSHYNFQVTFVRFGYHALEVWSFPDSSVLPLVVMEYPGEFEW